MRARSDISRMLSVLLLAIGCAHRDAQRDTDTTSTRVAGSGGTLPARAESAFVPRFLGCYSLDLGDGKSNRLRLTDTPIGVNWAAVSFGPGSINTPGSQWSWTPLDSTRFVIEWGGIDSALEVTVTRRASGYVAEGTRWASGATPPAVELHPAVRQTECPGAQ